MKLKSIKVENYRSIRNQTLVCDNLTILVGPNGSGKSSFLRALDLFYDSSPFYTEADFYNHDTSKPIKITVTYSELDDEEKGYYQKYVQNNDLSVTRVLEWPLSRGGSRYHGMHLRNPDFSEFRKASGLGFRTEYNKLLESHYSEFPPYQNKEDAEDILRDWEEKHPDRCQYEEDEGQFFGYTPVGKWLLEQGTRYVFIPAVRDASKDAEEGKESHLTQMMDLVVRSALQGSESIRELHERVKTDYRQVMDPIRERELKDLERELDQTLKTFVPDAGVAIEWDTSGEITLPPPRASVMLTEDDFASPVYSSGHGLQRAYILSMFQLLGKIQSRLGSVTSSDQPSFIIAIEEPELYQHPNRQRYLARILGALSEAGITGVAERTQIIFTTHSPLFVDIRKCRYVRKLNKVVTEEGKPKETLIISTSLDAVARQIEIADNKPEGTYSGTTLAPRLKALMTPWMNEGFFADVAVLVEGEEDRAAILGVSESLGYDFESLGISVIPCMGKTNLDRPAVIFKQLGIPVYLIWDSDKGIKNAKPEDNHRLLRLMETCEVDWPHLVTDRFACFEQNLTCTLRHEIGDDIFGHILEKCCEGLSMKEKYAMKHPVVVKEIIMEARKTDARSMTLEKIVNRIISLHNR
jgi:putative ATP-dependent endonuclease of OLD family